MKTDFDYNSMPVSFAHCLNGHCLRADKCLRRQVTLRMPKERAAVMVINPEHVTSDGEDCTYFIDEKPVLFARGMKHLLDRVPLADATVSMSFTSTEFEEEPNDFAKSFGSSSNSVLVKLIERLMDKGISAY